MKNLLSKVGGTSSKTAQKFVQKAETNCSFLNTQLSFLPLRGPFVMQPNGSARLNRAPAKNLCTIGGEFEISPLEHCGPSEGLEGNQLEMLKTLRHAQTIAN